MQARRPCVGTILDNRDGFGAITSKNNRGNWIFDNVGDGPIPSRWGQCESGGDLGMRIIVGLSILVLALAAPAAAEDLYISQSGSGSTTGTSCTNARPIAFFESAANWGGGAGKIDPGDTVFFCGTITEATIGPGGSGSSGLPVVLDFSNATLSASTGIRTTTDYLTIRNSSQTNPSVAFARIASNNIVIEDNTIDGFCTEGAVWLEGAANNITIRNNYFRTGACTTGNQIDIISTEGAHNVLIEGNYLELRMSGSSHNDIIQTFQGGCAACTSPSDWTIRYNRAVLNTPDDSDVSILQMEAMTGTNYAYGNVFEGLVGAAGANGLVFYGSPSSQTWHFYNNTTIAKTGAMENVIRFLGTGVLVMRNALTYAPTQGTVFVNEFGTTTRTNNLWYGNSAPRSGDANGVYADPLFINYAGRDYTPQSQSPANGRGIAIGNTGIHTFDYGIAPGATWPHPNLQQRTGAWDIGAYVGSSAVGSPAAPTNVTILVQ
jgi:hypothetical protein